MFYINQFQDHETYRDYQKKPAYSQKKNFDSTKEGVIVNSFIKDGEFCDFNNRFIIPQDAKMPDDFFETQKKKTLKEMIFSNPLTPLCITTLAVLGGAALVTKALNKTAKLKLKLPQWEQLPDIARNMNLVSENEFVTYVAIQSPSIKTTIGALATFAFTSGVFMMKSFIDGFKEVWVKKQDAGIQRNLQENLIEVETKSFLGKNQIIRNMLSEKNEEISKIIKAVKNKKYEIPNVFKSFGISFGQNIPAVKKEKNQFFSTSNLMYLGTGILTLGLSIFLIKKTHGYIKNTDNEIAKYSEALHKKVQVILDKSSKELLSEHKDELVTIFETLNFMPEKAKQIFTEAGLQSNEITSLINKIEERSRRFVQAPESLGGKRGIQYYSYINDVQGHFYNWIMNRDLKSANDLTRNLFIALATVSGIGYIGKTSVDAIKEVQVKKVNANTELDLRKQLVNVELRNFSSKKNSIIQPLVNELKQKAGNSSNAEGLDVMANAILYEIKNGAPFVYS